MKLKYLHLFILFSTINLSLIAQNDIQHSIFSKFIKEDRLITINLPDGYQKEKDKKYPVLYCLDGEWIHEYAKGSVKFLSGEVGGHIPKMIIVSIPNTIRERDLYVNYKPDAGYNNFINFLEFELIEYINKKYRTNGFNMIFGWSSASSVVGNLMTTRSHLFDGYIQTGTGIGPKTEKFLLENLPKNDFKNKYLYACTEGVGSGRASGFKKYKAMTEQLKLKGLIHRFEILEDKNHAEVLSEGLYKGLKFIFEGIKIPEEVVDKGAESVWNYFKELDQEYNFKLDATEGILNESAIYLAYGAQKPKEAIALLLKGIELYPHATSLLGNLAEFYKDQNDKANTIKYYKMAVDNSEKGSATHQKYQVLYKSILGK